MIFATRFGLCRVVLCCCLLFAFNSQSAKSRVLELGNALQIREVSIIPPWQQSVDIVTAVIVSPAKLLIKLSVLWTGSPLHLTVGSSFLQLSNFSRKLSMSDYQLPSVKSEARGCVSSFDCEKEPMDLRKHTNGVKPQVFQNTLKEEEYKKKLILNPQLLPKGHTPPSGPNPGHNAIILAEQKVKDKDTNSLPKSSTPSTPGLSSPRKPVIDSETQKLGRLPQLHLESKPKRSATPPSGPTSGHNHQILTGSVTSNNMLLREEQAADAVIQQLKEDGELVAEKTSPISNPTMRNGLALINQLPKAFKPPSSPNRKHSNPSDIKHEYQPHCSSPSTDSLQKPVNDDQREICDRFSASTQNLSELVGCEQDILAPSYSMNHPSTSAAFFRTNPAMQQNMHNSFSKAMPSRP